MSNKNTNAIFPINIEYWDEISSNASKKTITFEWGKESYIDYEKISEFCFDNKPREIDIDLLIVVSSAMYADRIVKRKVRNRNIRRFHLEIPVHFPKEWSKEKIKFSLESCLHFLTGDHWEFSFIKRKEREKINEQLSFLPDSLEKESVVFSYSAGLASSYVANKSGSFTGSTRN